jgi:hypothetical protein
MLTAILRIRNARDARRRLWMKIRRLPKTLPSKEKEGDTISVLFADIFSRALARWSRGETRFAKYTASREGSARDVCAKAMPGMNEMNERSNGSCGAAACGDNLFAVIRTAKETIWRPFGYPPPGCIHLMRHRHSEIRFARCSVRFGARKAASGFLKGGNSSVPPPPPPSP